LGAFSRLQVCLEKPPFHSICGILGFGVIRGQGKAMRPKFIFALAAVQGCAGHVAFAGNIMFGPGPGLTGNETGGIITYAPGLDRRTYHQMAANWCAR
jgi:hypothetical protein